VIRKFLSHVLPGVLVPLRVLWNQIIGFVFVVLAVWSAPSAYRHIRDYDGGPESLFKVLLTVCFAAVMGFFGFLSFFKARKIGKRAVR
jgi:hypothetical protein